MSNKLNDFKLPHKTLHTAGKWCLKDLSVGMSPTDRSNLKPEILRQGIKIDGCTGQYGKSSDTRIIHAGIYEIAPNLDASLFLTLPEPSFFYYSMRQSDGTRKVLRINDCYAGYDCSISFNGPDGGGYLANREPYHDDGSGGSTQTKVELNFLDELIYVPQDLTLTHSEELNWRKFFKPFVSCTVKLPETIKLSSNKEEYVGETIYEKNLDHTLVHFDGTEISRTYLSIQGTTIDYNSTLVPEF